MSDTTTLVEATRQLTHKELVALVLELQTRIASLEEARTTTSAPSTTGKEMTEADALAVLNGEHAGKKHKEAAAALGLTYGQVYSCRLEFTFKQVHKQLKEQGFKNVWVK